MSSLVLLRLNERDLVIDALMADGSNSIKLWALHSAVRAGNGFESVRLQYFSFTPQLRPIFVLGIRTRIHTMSGRLSALL